MSEQSPKAQPDNEKDIDNGSNDYTTTTTGEQNIKQAILTNRHWPNGMYGGESATAKELIR